MAPVQAMSPTHTLRRGPPGVVTPTRTTDQFEALRAESETLERVLDALDRLAGASPNKGPT